MKGIDSKKIIPNKTKQNKNNNIIIKLLKKKNKILKAARAKGDFTYRKTV